MGNLPVGPIVVCLQSSNPAAAHPVNSLDAPMPPPAALARRVFLRHRALHPLAHYTGILSLQALVRLAMATGDATTLALAREELEPFVRGEVAPFGNFAVYAVGGNGTALLHRHGHWPEARAALERAAAEQLAAPRGAEGVFCRPRGIDRERGMVWIDAAFAVCPFFASCGAAFAREDFLEEAVRQIVPLYRMLLDDSCGLVNQGINFDERRVRSADHWSRGNGWGLLALAEIVAEAPPDSAAWRACAPLLGDWLQATLRHANYEGLWFQEMTVTNPKITYTETSGSGLILYALGVAWEHGVVSEAVARPAFDRGLAGLAGYLSAEGSVYNTCVSCCCPGRGEIADFLAKPPMRDDWHAFGPVILLLAQAHALGYRSWPEPTPLRWHDGYQLQPAPAAGAPAHG
jgi:unsaturated rhamnogalacturonyl hydrolase